MGVLCVALLGIPITCPYLWVDEQICPDELLRHVFRSDGEEEIPLLPERIAVLREAGEILCEVYPPLTNPILGSQPANTIRDMTAASSTS